MPACATASVPAAEPVGSAQCGPVATDDRPWTYTVSVRSLCEFTAKRGDLDRRFTPSATATEGLKGQFTVTARRGQDYETEIQLEGRHGGLRVRGRADGYDPRRRCLEEIKTIRGQPDDIPENRRQLHWAQLQTYGALFCQARGLSEVSLALVYFDVASQSEVELLQLCSAEELQDLFEERCGRFLHWAKQEATHRRDRDAGLEGLVFPRAPFRAGQRSLAEAVYRTAASKRCLVAQAPTGIGKTLGTLFPVLRAMPGDDGIDKLAYLTCKGTGRLTALEALDTLRQGTAGTLRMLVMVAKEEACEHPDKACHGDACPLARGFYDRLPAARADAVAEGWLDAPAQRRIAMRHGVCPYYLGQELVRWADVVVGDVHHAFDPNGTLWGLLQAHEWRMAVLVDEAHNLVERTRRMYSAGLALRQVEAARDMAPAPVRPKLDALLQAARDVADSLDAPYSVLTEVPDRFLQAVLAAVSALAEHFQDKPLAVGALLGFQFELQRFAKLLDALGEHSIFDVEASRSDVTYSVRNVVPGRFLAPRFKAFHSCTLFSATLAPPDYAIKLLGLPDDTAWIDVPPAFPPEHLQVRVARGISTRYVHRSRSLGRLVDTVGEQFNAHPGNYLAFFSSFEYLQAAAKMLASRWPDVPQWQQEPRMAMSARQQFLDRFVEGGRGVGFAVLGGVFAEGVDLPGTRLIGAFIATLGLPAVSPVNEQMRARVDQLFGAEHAYGDLVPAMQRVVQAAGRVLRSPDDRGWLWLLDDRYERSDVARLLPSGWAPQSVRVRSRAPAASASSTSVAAPLSGPHGSPWVV